MSLWRKLQARKKLVTAFQSANIYRTQGDYKIYPAIKSVQINDHSTIFTIRLPTGLNPDLLNDNLYVFKQVFGENVVIDGDIKHFTITAYHSALTSNYSYLFEEWQPIIEHMNLPVIVGRDLNNQPVVFDMAIFPHLLISGTTGSGKSSLLRAILTTIILAKKPDSVRLLLGDLKRSEFGLFRNIAHVEGVHITPTSLLSALRVIKVEMERRGDLLDKYEATHISELPMMLPYFIIAIDEVALLRQEKEIMAIIEDISSVGRSLGCLLICAMQRPDSKVLEGRLKNNLTVRISGRQTNKSNAKIAETPGAELIKPTEKGRMIFVLEEPIEVQSPLLEYSKAKKLLQPFKTKPPATTNTNEFKFGMLEE